MVHHFRPETAELQKCFEVCERDWVLLRIRSASEIQGSSQNRFLTGEAPWLFRIDPKLTHGSRSTVTALHSPNFAKPDMRRRAQATSVGGLRMPAWKASWMQCVWA